jgi:hypothetical protein
VTFFHDLPGNIADQAGKGGKQEFSFWHELEAFPGAKGMQAL